MHKSKTTFDNHARFWYKIGVDCDNYRKFFLWYDGQKIATAIKRVTQKNKVLLYLKHN